MRCGAAGCKASLGLAGFLTGADFGCAQCIRKPRGRTAWPCRLLLRGGGRPAGQHQKPERQVNLSAAKPCRGHGKQRARRLSALIPVTLVVVALVLMRLLALALLAWT